MGYNRYSKLLRDGYIRKVPGIKLTEKNTDYYITYKRGFTRLDNISYDAYGDSSYEWLILLANQDIALMEFEIEDGTQIRVTYPLQDTLDEYNKKIDNYDKLYHID